MEKNTPIVGMWYSNPATKESDAILTRAYGEFNMTVFLLLGYGVQSAALRAARPYS